MKRSFLALAAGLFVLPIGAQESSLGSSYRIGARDQLQIHVEEMEDLNQEVTVAEDGTISLPMVGTLEAQGLTESLLETRLRSLLENRGLRKATVTVSVTNYRSRPVSILGAVAKPGNHFVPGQATLLSVLMDAGGIAEGHGAEIVVRRRVDNGLSDEVHITVADLVEVGDPRVNIPIFAGDLIHVPVARQLTVHLIGEVANPGSLTFQADQRATLLTAIARVGGLTEKASKKIRIRRHDSAGEGTEVVADFRQILNNTAPDPELHDGDLVIVKESFF